MLPGGGGEDIVVRWVIDPTGAEQGAQRATQAVEQGAERQQRAAARTDVAVDRNARSYQSYARDAARLSRGVAAGISAATAAVMAQERSWLGVASVVLTSFAAGGPILGAITAVGAAVGFLVGKLKEGSTAMEQMELHAKKLDSIIQSTADARHTLAAFKELGREPTGAETELSVTNKVIENLRSALSTSRADLIREMFSENTSGERLDLLRKIVKQQEDDLAAMERQARQYGELIAAEKELAALREKSAKALADAEAAIERTIAKGPRRTTTDYEESRARRFLSESRTADELERKIAETRRLVTDKNLMGGPLSDAESAIRMYEKALGEAKSREREREVAEMAARLEAFRSFGDEAGMVLEGSLVASITDGIFEGFKNARAIVESFARDFMQITLRALYQATIGDAVLGFFRGLFGSFAGGAAGGGTYADVATSGAGPQNFGILPQLGAMLLAVVPSRAIAGGIETDFDLQAQLAALGRAPTDLQSYRAARY